MRAWIRWHLLRHVDDLHDGTRARALLHLGLSLLGDPAERRLGQQEAEIERLRCQLDSERRDLDEARRAIQSLADLVAGGDPAKPGEIARAIKDGSAIVARQRDEARLKLAAALDGRDPETGRHDAYLCERRKRRDAEQELRALLALLTPRTYREGDPVPEGPVLWWRSWVHDRGWRLLRPDLLGPGDRWLPLPPPPDEDKRWGSRREPVLLAKSINHGGPGQRAQRRWRLADVLLYLGIEL